MTEQDSSGVSLDDVPSFLDRHDTNPVVFALVILGALFLLYQLVGGLLALVVMGIGMKLDRTNVDAMRGATVLAQLLFLCVPTLMAARLVSKRWTSVFPFHPPSVRESLSAVVALVSLQRLFDAYLFFQNLVPLPESLSRIVEPFKKMMEEMMHTLVKAEGSGELLFVLLVVALVPAFVEEVLFRGFVISTFLRKWPPLRAALVSGMIFGAYHFNPFELVPLMGLGMFLGVLRVSSDSLFLPVAAHFLNNFMAVLAIYWGWDQPPELNPSAPSGHAMIGMALQGLLCAGLFLAAFRFYRRAAEDRRREQEERP